MTIDIGIAKEAREEIAEGLCDLLSDTYSLYIKTHNFHVECDRPHVWHSSPKCLKNNI